MSDLRGVISKKVAVGASSANMDGVSALIANAPAIVAGSGVAGLAIGAVVSVTRLTEAEALGITAAYDADNDVLLHRHISEFYRMVGDGVKLYIMLCATAKTMAEMITENHVALIAGAKGEIRQTAVSYNPPAGYTPVYVDGMESVVRNAIAPAQAMHDYSWDTDRPLHVVLEGRGINGLAVSMLNLRAIEVDNNIVEYNNVSICIGQDWNYADALTGNQRNYADVGTMLGCIAKIGVHKNIGEVGDDVTDNPLNITSTKKGVWMVAGLSDHSKIVARELELQIINDKGYVFGIEYTGFAGYRWNDDHVCAPIIIDTDDNMNVHTIALSRTMNKLARRVRSRLLPHVKATVPLDPKTGLLPTGMLKYFQGEGEKAFQDMSGELSGGSVFVDPTSDLLTGDKELRTSFTLVPVGTVGQITANLNIKKSV